MIGIPAKCILLILASNLAFTVVMSTNSLSAKKTYIVKMDNSAMPESFSNHIEWYTSKVKSIVSKPETSEGLSAEVDDGILYHYQTIFHGFAAQLTEHEVNKLEEEDGVLATFPEKMYELLTTRSPSFLGLDKIKYDLPLTGPGSNIIVAILDTGVWPHSESFNDKNMTAVPSHWKGTCETGPRFPKKSCNKKLIGARMFYKGFEGSGEKIEGVKSPLDQFGHGTHTASTAAGRPVQSASTFGYANGTTMGMAHGARVAAYKVCWNGGLCAGSDILAGMEAAIADRADVLSLSLGSDGIIPYSDDPVAIASFHAMEKGIFVSCAAGNSGPFPSAMANYAPWIATVGASTLDRDFPAIVELGNKRKLAGISRYSGRKKFFGNKQYPLVYLGSNDLNIQNFSSLCIEGALNPDVVKGKIVICARRKPPSLSKAQAVEKAGGAGMVLINLPNDQEDLAQDFYDIPAVYLRAKEGQEIVNYALSSRSATATLEFLGTKLGVKPAPVVALFSSRGPNPVSLEIMKPDIVAPGKKILASWPYDVPPTGLSIDKHRVKFNIVSGTSMACPHVSGIAALLKAKHPDWSPAAIKSALVTTAYIHDNTNNVIKDESTSAPANSYVFGAGHINPPRAFHPGLVYDIAPQDYFEFLCTQKYTSKQLRIFSDRACHNSMASPSNLNYPAISVVFPGDKSVSSVTVHRTVTNVGLDVSNYHINVTPFKSASVSVEPNTLKFTRIHQKLSYKVVFKTKKKQVDPEFGELIWTDGKHEVRSPIVLNWLQPK